MIAKNIKNKILVFTFLKLAFTKKKLERCVTKLVARLLVTESSLGLNQDIPKKSRLSVLRLLFFVLHDVSRQTVLAASYIFEKMQKTMEKKFSH
jgi:hypothetical protein